MATNDTDPQRTEPFADDASRTEPGAPPPDAGGDVAASLLADLAKAPLPEEVAETEGHVAAAYAAAPHRPPRANDKTVENPAVFINATVPLPPPPSSGRQKLGPPAPSVVSMNAAPTVPGGPRLFDTTEPGERTRNQTRVILASIAGVVVAALIAIVILVVSSPARPPSAVVASPSSTPPALSPDPPVVVTPPPPATIIGSSAPAPVATTKPTHNGNARPQPTSRSSGTFADPDRTF